MEEFSLLTTDFSICYDCANRGKRNKATVDHAIYGNDEQSSVNYEARSKQDGLIVPLCWACNLKLTIDPRKRLALQVEGQLAFEQAYPNKDFKKRYGKSYL